MSEKEFIELYCNADDETQDAIKTLLEASEKGIDLPGAIEQVKSIRIRELLRQEVATV